LSLFSIGTDDENRVIAGNGADHFIPARRIEGDGDWLRAADGGLQNELILRLADVAAEFTEQALDGGRLRLGSEVSRGGVAIGSLDQPKGVNIARERCLVDTKSVARKAFADFFLVREGLLFEELHDAGLSSQFGHMSPRNFMHNDA